MPPSPEQRQSLVPNARGAPPTPPITPPPPPVRELPLHDQVPAQLERQDPTPSPALGSPLWGDPSARHHPPRGIGTRSRAQPLTGPDETEQSRPFPAAVSHAPNWTEPRSGWTCQASPGRRRGLRELERRGGGERAGMRQRWYPASPQRAPPSRPPPRGRGRRPVPRHWPAGRPPPRAAGLPPRPREPPLPCIHSCPLSSLVWILDTAYGRRGEAVLPASPLPFPSHPVPSMQGKAPAPQPGGRGPSQAGLDTPAVLDASLQPKKTPLVAPGVGRENVSKLL
ncbi:uncharacterized protein LOC125929108 [Panthera uncia]|uniref:uncharacterized protein LOC125929108 n=1 Tax=Panthera uncia TaxID=29064 RepID=UPI0020FFCB84|nr:uncharacterized protein LOC125929108 [Panthera uncia]